MTSVPAGSATTASSQTITIRVLAASTGVSYKISLHPSELTVANIRARLAAAVPISDQILLLGPPYKVPKDSTLQSHEVLNSLRLGDAEDNPIPEDIIETQPTPTDSHNADTAAVIGTEPIQRKKTRRPLLSSTEKTGARRLFLFSKQALSENAPEPPPCRLEPGALTLPTDAPGTSTLNMTQSAYASQPLHQALVAYERQFMLYLAQGRVLADGADLRLTACRQCVQEQAIMARALRAAVSNLSDHFNNATRTRSDFATQFHTKVSSHTSLLQRFESILSSLGNIPLHPALIQIARNSGRVMETLLDTVPVERERTWAQQCQTSHQRLLSLFSELDNAFAQLGTPSSRDEETRRDLQAERDIQSLSDEIETTCQNIRDRQAKRVEQLTLDHGKVLKIIMDAIDENSATDNVQSAFTPLQQLSNASRDIIPAMEADDQEFQRLSATVADAKTAVMKRMKVRLREVSVAQSSIQRVLHSIGVLKDALNHQCENMVHLEHVAELPTAYKDFLDELRRRRAYGHAVGASSAAMIERLAMMRADEVKSREKFLRGKGRHLMPPFFEIFVPTLATPPPLFTPQVPALIELEMLPDIESSSSTAEEADRSIMGGQEGGISSASSLTAETGHPQLSEKMPTVSIADEQSTGNPGVSNNPDHLIVSADENSGNGDVIMDPMTSIAEEAERKTLAYENEMLRQQVERMGGKAPRPYIEGAAARMGSSEADALKLELAEAQARAEKAEKALAAKTAAASTVATSSAEFRRENDDRISHSSISVGDVALFMGTGRDANSKRTYVAFNTNCPHRYLSMDGIKGSPPYVVGRVIYEEERIADVPNPLGLRKGTRYYMLTVEDLKNSKPSSSSRA